MAVLEVRGLTKRYGTVQALDGVDLEVGDGELVGLLGPNGAGKSTLIKCVSGAVEPTEGAVLVDRVVERTVDPIALRREVAVVNDDPFLFSASVHENIAYARPDATREEVERAAELSGAAEFIRRLPQGYETRIGERGSRLSRGEA